MKTEIEAKWLNIDLNLIRKNLESIGAVLVKPDRLMVRSPFDFPDFSLEKKHGWVRVRNEGDKTTLSYKQVDDRTLHGTKEITIIVDDFDATCDFLNAIGLEAKSFQETRRESWKLGETEIELDTWPWIPSFIEIEAKTEDDIRNVTAKLGLDFADALHGSVELAYQNIYDVTEEEIDHWDKIVFSDVPDWLAAKRKKN